MRTLRHVLFFLLCVVVGVCIAETDLITGHHTNLSYISREAVWSDKPKEGGEKE